MSTAANAAKTHNGNQSPYFSIREAVEFTKSSEATIRRKLSSGELTRYKFGGRTLIKISELVSSIKPAREA